MSEFDLISSYLSKIGSRRDDVILGVGDDAALVAPKAGQQLAIALDTLISGVHFPVNTTPEDIAYKALAVNLSDLAAIGADPVWATLALTLPDSDESWLKAFAAGFDQLARQHDVQLIGGDTTRGPLSISVQVAGEVPPGKALRRDGGKPGDKLYVTGTIGDAGLGLKSVFGEVADELVFATARLNRPSARVHEGLALRGIASACIDVSDGLLADLQHILDASHCGAIMAVYDVPLSEEVSSHFELLEGWPGVLNAGDDYELCFTVPPSHEPELLQVAEQWDCPIRCIGELCEGRGIRCVDKNGQTLSLTTHGYDHFGSVDE